MVVDTLSRALAGGNENSSEDMGALVQNMDAIRAETGACVLFIHHTGKDQARGARGWSGLRAAIDTEIEVVADERAGIATATVVKQRDMPKGSAFGFRLETVVLGRNRHGEDVTTCVVEPTGLDASRPAKGARLSGDQVAALRVLQDAIAEHGRNGTPRRPALASCPSQMAAGEIAFTSGARSTRPKTPRNTRSAGPRTGCSGPEKSQPMPAECGWCERRFCG